MFTGGILFAVKGLDNRIEVTHYDISSPKIPEGFDGYKILQISDYHADSVPGLIEEIEHESPDIIVSTGDLVHDTGSYTPGVRLCKHLIDIAPVYAVTGNHDLWRSDYEDFERELTAIGVKTLHDERVILKRNESEISLSGIDDPFALNSVKIVENIENSLAKLPRYNGYDILLFFHRANLFDRLKIPRFQPYSCRSYARRAIQNTEKAEVSLRLNRWGSKSSMFFPKYFAGHYHAPHTDMIVNRGIGNPMLLPRLFNRPEITVITLKHKRRYEKMENKRPFKTIYTCFPQGKTQGTYNELR